MQKSRIAKLFMNGSSQAVRLPAEFRFANDEVYIQRDEATGDVVLSTRPGVNTWYDFFEFMQGIDVPKTFMADRLMNIVPRKDGVFDDAA